MPLAGAALDAFGNAIGNSIVGQMRFNALPDDIKEKSPEEISKFEQARVAARNDHPDATSDELDRYARNRAGLQETAWFSMTPADLKNGLSALDAERATTSSQ